MLLLALTFISTMLTFMALAAFAAWFVWPRIAHMRKMQDPVAKATTEYSLMQQALSVEKHRIEIEMLQLKVVGKDEAIFDATQRMLHQNATSVTSQAMLQAPTENVTLPELMPHLDRCDSILVIGRKGAGKSNVLRRIIDKRRNVTVLDPHASPAQWGAHQVIGAGLDFDAIHSTLHETTELERRRRYKQLGQGVTQFSEQTYCFDEMTEVTSEIDVTSPVQRLLNCRKVDMKVVMGGHSMNAKDLGLDGKFNLLKNFDAVVRIDYNKATNERRWFLCLQPTNHHDTFFEVANPGEYVPAFVPTPVPTPVPTEDRTGTGQEQDGVGQKSPVTADSYVLNFGDTVEDKIYFLLRQKVRAGQPLKSIGRDTIKQDLRLEISTDELTRLTREAKERVMKEQQQS